MLLMMLNTEQLHQKDHSNSLYFFMLIILLSGGDARFKDYREHVNAYKSDERKENAIILLQRLLRGRAFQNSMYEGKEKRLALIEELLIVANVEALSEEAVEERLLQAHEERLKDAIVESIQGEVIARAADMLSKELIRFKQVNFLVYLKLFNVK